MKLSIYKNPRNDHTFQVDKRGPWYVISEYDWLGDECNVLGKYEERGRAQESMDKLADAMEWKFAGEQE